MPEWVGKTVRQLELRSRFGLNVIAMRNDNDITIPPDIDVPIAGDQILVILGKYEMFENLKKKV